MGWFSREFAARESDSAGYVRVIQYGPGGVHVSMNLSNVFQFLFKQCISVFFLYFSIAVFPVRMHGIGSFQLRSRFLR